MGNCHSLDRAVINLKNNPWHWQITFRDVFKNSLEKGDGYLIVPRDGILFIPLKEVQKS